MRRSAFPNSSVPLEIGLAALADIATGLAQTAPLWEPCLAADAAHRTGLRLISTNDYDAWLLRWPTATNVDPHDHGVSAGAFTVVAGELTELRWRSGLRQIRSVVPGEVVTIDRGVVHDVIAAGPDPALSVHVYAPPLTAMGFYDQDGRMVDRRPVDATTERFADARTLHPAGRSAAT